MVFWLLSYPGRLSLSRPKRGRLCPDYAQFINTCSPDFKPSDEHKPQCYRYNIWKPFQPLKPGSTLHQVSTYAHTTVFETKM